MSDAVLERPLSIGERLHADPDFLLETVARLDALRFEATRVRFRDFDGHDESSIESAVDGLERDGIAVWPGFVTDADLLEELRVITFRGHLRARRLFAAAAPDASVLDDPKTGWCYRRGAKVAQDGITRIDFRLHETEIPEEVRLLWDDPRAHEVMSRYFRVPTRPYHAVCERVFRDPTTDLYGWHIDRVMDQGKVMILLHDVDHDLAPMRYRAGTHRAIPAKKELLSDFVTRGILHSEVSTSEVSEMPGQTRVLTGRAGDAVFFDTGGLHVRSMCYRDVRDVLNLGFSDVDTPKNRLFAAIRGSRWM